MLDNFEKNMSNIDILNDTLNEEHVALGYAYEMNNYSKVWDFNDDKWNEDKHPKHYDFQCYGRKFPKKEYPELH